jgi:hypothetical protein
MYVELVANFSTNISHLNGTMPAILVYCTFSIVDDVRWTLDTTILSIVCRKKCTLVLINPMLFVRTDFASACSEYSANHWLNMLYVLNMLNMLVMLTRLRGLVSECGFRITNKRHEKPLLAASGVRAPCSMLHKGACGVMQLPTSLSKSRQILILKFRQSITDSTTCTIHCFHALHTMVG